MTIKVSSLLLVLSYCQYLIGRTNSFQIITPWNQFKGLQLKRSTLISPKIFSTGNKSGKTCLASFLQNDEKELLVFNSDAVIPRERWDFADDIYLITTTEKGSQRLERTKEQLEKVNMLDKVKIRTFTPDNEDRVRGCYTSHIKILYEIQSTFKNKEDYNVIILEDNLEITRRMSETVLKEVANFVESEKNWDVFHLAYMMYVPGLSLIKLPVERTANVVRMITEESASVGTSAYIISKKGVEAFLELDKKTGYTEAIPNIMAKIFPDSRYAAYPMVFHRAAKVGSLVNPQLDDFRKIMFNPVMYTNWERLMVSTGLQNNQLFPALLISLLTGAGVAVYSAVTAGSESNSAGVIGSAQLLVAVPLLVALWGASLFKPGNTGAGFAKSQQQLSKEKNN